MNHKSLLTTLVILTLALLGTACGAPASAQKAAGAKEPATRPAHVIEMSTAGLTVPEELPGGIVSLTFNNKTDAEHMPILARFNEGVTVEQFDTALAGDDPMAAFALVHWLGGTSLTPKTEHQMVYDLVAGQHVLIDFGEQGPQTAYFKVTGDQSSQIAPKAAITAELKDFTVILPDKIKAGSQTWHIENSGNQWHEMQIVKLNEGITVQAAIDFMSQGPTPDGPPPFETVAFVAPLNQGEEVWTDFNLEPGEYTIICALPDLTGSEEHSHAHLGMVRQLTVTN
ncbi:MAG: hypothetical protein R3264_12530 [Anaerolineae bacterium]|nr:hypothetical protein [Anaerolineae bacterium]